MSCGRNGLKVAISCAIRNGVSRLASQVAYTTRTPWGQSHLALASRRGAGIGMMIGLTGGAGLLALATRRRRSAEPVGVGPGGALVDTHQFDLKAGADLTAIFGGATAPVSSLTSAVGDRQQPGKLQPLVKLGGEDDLFAAAGPRGQIAFSLPDGPEGEARIEGVLPARGRADDLSGALDGRLPKYLIADPETDDVFVTRNPYEATQFAKALNEDPVDGVSAVYPGETEFDGAYRPVPAALFY